jgi:hypothetical protein
MRRNQINAEAFIYFLSCPGSSLNRPCQFGAAPEGHLPEIEVIQ